MSQNLQYKYLCNIIDFKFYLQIVYIICFQTFIYTENLAQNVSSSYKFNDKFEESLEIDDDEISQHEIKAKDMQNRVNTAGKQKNYNGFNGSQYIDGRQQKMGGIGNSQKDNKGVFNHPNGNLLASQNFMNQDNRTNTIDNNSKYQFLTDITPMNQNLTSSKKSSAVCLVQFHLDSNRMELGTLALEILHKYSENKISFVSITGLYRSGKSALLNKLLDIRNGDGFKVEDTVNGCTQGIWMWPYPEYNDKEDLYLFFIDTEGLQNVEQSQDHDTKIFTLYMLISSLLIYNSKGAIDEQSINQLGIVTKLTQNISISDNNGEKINEYMLAQYTPKFLWLLRDFSQELYINKIKNNANQYLEDCLMEDGVGPLQYSNKNVKKAILSYFKDRSCLTMIKPINDEEKLKQMDKLQLEDLRSDFSKQVVALRSLIYQKTSPKLFNGQYMNGRMMCSMIDTFVNNINNKGGIPNVVNAWQNIVQNECMHGQSESLKLFDQEMEKLLVGNQPAVDFMELYSNFRTIRDKVLEKYDSIAGIREKNQFYNQYRIELISHMEVKEQSAFEKNEDNASMQNDDKIKKLIENIRNKIDKEEYSHQNIDQFIQEFIEFVRKYDQTAVGIKKAEILSSYVHQINDSFINLLITSIKKDFENKKENKQQTDQQNQDKEKFYQEQIDQLDINITKFEEMIKYQEKQKHNHEQDKEKQLRKLEDVRKEVENLQNTIRMDVPELQQTLEERNQTIEKLQTEIKQLKKNKKKGCCG